MDNSKMPEPIRTKVINLAERLGWQVNRRANGEDLYDKLIGLTHALYPSQVYIDKNVGVKKSGIVNYFKVIVHPDHYQQQREDLSNGIRAAINKKTKINRHSHSGFQGFRYYPENNEPCGMGYLAEDEAALGYLLAGLCGKVNHFAGAKETKVVTIPPEEVQRPERNTNEPVLIQKALIIDSPWIDKILAGDKIWEMRSRNTETRGWIGLIQKGSGKVVGVVRLANVLGPFAREQLQATIDKHQIRDEIDPDTWMDKWNFAWVLEHAISLPEPVPYQHPNGAVIWVNLEADVLKRLHEQLGDQLKVG